MANNGFSFRRLAANRLLLMPCAFAALYGLYLVYVVANLALVPGGERDPVYLVWGISRTDQFVGVSLVFAAAILAPLTLYLVRNGRRLDFSSDRAIKRGSLLLVSLLFANAAAASLAAVLEELDSRFWLPLSAWIATVLLVELLVVYVALSRLERPRLQLLLMAGLGAVNLLALYFSLLALFVRQPGLIQLAVIGCAFVGFSLLFVAVGKRIVPVGAVNTVFAVMVLGPVAGLAWSPTTAPKTADRLAPFDNIAFHSKPDIHIISIDALSPAALVRKYMAISDLPYAQLLSDDGVVVFKNAFASQVPTRPSLNSLMRLAHKDFAGDNGYFAGRADGPVTHILRANGYTITTGFDQFYFGSKGQFVDSYRPDPTSGVDNSTLCALATDNPFKFFGFCAIAALFTDLQPAKAWPERIIDIVRRASATTKTAPSFTLHYMVNPIGHTALDYRSSDGAARTRYAAQYRDGAARVAEILTRLREVVRSSTVPSILIVMGDHGPFLSRTVALHDNPAYVVQDQHGILAAVLVNNTGCSTEHLQAYATTYTTPERILAGVFRCLAEDPARIDAAMNFEEAFPFEEFVYE